MKIDRYFRLYVVSTDGITDMSLHDYALAVQGGLHPDAAIFTTREEAADCLQRQELLGRAAFALQELPTPCLKEVVETLEREKSGLVAMVRLAREVSVAETLKKCGI